MDSSIKWAFHVEKSCLIAAGGHKGRALIPSHDRLVLSLEWSDPFGGQGTDEFVMPTQDDLHVHSTINLQGGTAKYTTRYKRK